MDLHPALNGPSGQPKAPSGRRGRRRGVEIRPGTVKQARMDAGLSLGQVARSDISRTAIYFVETGKAKPSMETLRLIADRTGRPLDYFLAETATAPLPAADLAELERLMAVGDNLGAAARTEHLLGQRLDPESEARVKLIAAMAYLRLAQPAAARRYAVAARTYFERTGDRVTAVEALGSEAQAAYLMQDPAALPLAESALEILRTLKSYPQAAQARVLAILAAVHLQNQNWQEAIDKYEEAIAAGDVVQDLRNLSVMYSGLSLAYQESGQINDATRYAQKALTIHETLNDRLSLARTLNNLGYMLVQLDEFGPARRHIERAITIFEEEGVETGKGNFILSLAELEFAQGDLQAAEAKALEAAALSARLGERAIEAESHVWLGRIAAERGDEAAADSEFAFAVGAAGELGPGPRLSQVHEAYAEVLEARGDLGRANRHLKEALAASQPAGARRAVLSRIAIA
ncbi:MAG TPA: tetratricopeptide repeat protein [Candidatus Udaeobacter sp.]|nr:tetratricopeptide repeat protein [Candidatus Udaeobacter sp.]